jgi:hypothetical protein
MLIRCTLSAAVLACLAATAACGSSDPQALPDDAAFRSCLTKAGVSPSKLDSSDARRAAFHAAEPWGCVLNLASPDDRHAVLAGLFKPDDDSLIAPLTAWIDEQDGDGDSIAADVGKLLAAVDEPLPDDSDAASLRSQDDGILNDRLALIIYLHADGKPPGYDAYLARPDMKGKPDAQNRYVQAQLRAGGPAADRLGDYSDTISQERADLRPS